jgi:hypothetical protein
VAELRKMLLARVTPEVLAHIVDGLIEKAKKGDVAAVRLVLQYTLGSPLAASSPDRVEHEDWELRVSRPTPSEMGAVLLERQPVELANIIGEGVDVKHWSEARTGWREESARVDRRELRRQERRRKREERGARQQPRQGPSTNGGNGKAAPSANGENGNGGPSGNGANGHGGPSANGENGAVRKNP